MPLALHDRVDICRRADIERLRDAHISMGSPQASLWCAVVAGELLVVTATTHDAALPMGEIKRIGRPVMVIVEDDPPVEMPAVSAGPDAWTCTPLLRRWARSVVVHGAAALPEHYRAAVASAVSYGRLVLVHTSSCHVAAWAASLRCPRMLVLQPAAGKMHPVTQVPGTLQ